MDCILETVDVRLRESTETQVVQQRVHVRGGLIVDLSRSCFLDLSMPSQQESVTVRAVCVLRNGEGNNIQGVIRFAQMIGLNQMKITGELHGLPADRKLTFRVHEFGDLSSGATSTGGRFNPTVKTAQTSNEGEYGRLQIGTDGLAKIDLIDTRLTLFGPSSIIGRSVVITDEKDEDLTRADADENKGVTTTPSNRLAAGVIGICQ